MDFLDELLSELGGKKFQIKKEKENFTHAEVILVNADLHLPDASVVEGFLKKVPSRDTLHISFVKNGESIGAYSVKGGKPIANVIEELGSDYPDETKVTITKSKVENKISIYRPKAWAEEFCKLSVWDTISSIGGVMEKESLCIVVPDNSSIELRTETLYIGDKQNALSSRSASHDAINSNFISNCHFSKAGLLELNPFDLWVTSSSMEAEKIKRHLNKISSFLSIVYLFDISDIDENTLTYKLNGYKSIHGSIESGRFQALNFGSIYFEIFKWVYQGSNFQDKIGIARNVISLHLKGDQNLSITANAMDSVKSAFQLYQKQNIKQYLEVRSKLGDQLIEYSNKASKITENIASNFQKSVFSAFSFFASILIVRVLSKGNFENVFTKDAVVLTVVFLAASIGYLIISYLEVVKEIRRFKDSYSDMKLRYEDIMNKKDIASILNNDNEFKKNIEYIKSKRSYYTIFWGLMVAVILLATIYLSN